MYYRESFEYSPIKIFMNSNSADTVTNRGNVTFNLRNSINLPNNVIGYVSLIIRINYAQFKLQYKYF